MTRSIRMRATTQSIFPPSQLRCPPVLAVPITTIDLKLSDITYNDNLTYHYAGGVALGALKRWKEAEEFLEICASSPAQVPAAIQLEASKKLVLIQLILYGKVRPMSCAKFTYH